MESEQRLQLKRYLDTLSRRKWMIIAGFLLGISCGLIFYLKQEKVYKSEALLSYQQQKINPSQMSPDEQAGIRDVVSTLSQLVLSRTSLEKIIKEENLYKDLREIVPMEDVVELMRSKIGINQSRTGDTFVIQYEGKDPAKVVRVTNGLAAKFIDENLQYREERASETSLYTQNELDMAKDMLDEKEAVMRDYKLKYYNEMPDQRAINMSRLIALQEQYQGRQESIQDLERTRALIQDQINVRKQIIEENQRYTVMLQAGAQEQGTSIKIDQRGKLEMLQNSLAGYQDRYTDQHPMVKRLKKQIANVEKLIAEEEQQKMKGESDTEAPKNFDDELFSMEIQLKDIRLSIDKLEKEKEEIQAMIGKYEEWVASAPIREAEWSSLTREYGELKRHYDFLVAQNLQASSALNLERKQKGSQFRIEDPARIPETPTKPDFRKIMLLAIGLGILGGGSLAFGLEAINTSFRSQFELEQKFDIPVLCSVPSLPLTAEIIKKKFWSTAKVGFFLVWFSALSVAFVFLVKEGKIVTPYLQFLQ
jgi:polysaccharide chain length determinant protein (PEP-CTERM system associated)